MAGKNAANKWVFIGGSVIAAAALVVFFQNYPPEPKDAVGTVGAAQRYHSTQITGNDVTLDQTELTTWIQSETFDRIVKDPEARALFANDAVMDALKVNAVRDQAIRGNEAFKLNAGRKLDQAMLNKGNDALVQALKGNQALVQAVLSNDAFMQALRNQAFMQAINRNAALLNGLRIEARRLDALTIH
ncbi:MAG TPA: hypothetical protein VFB67_13375 [Candidatus Polarisedimenticolaceae bacterium]|nr:hypothetical protein [Candidatus Polarisedimenticolaceae bacterium]